MTPCTSPDGRHNFAVPGQNCMNGCGRNQFANVSKKVELSMDNIKYVSRSKLVRGIHSELHNFIDETRKAWSDKLPFGRWLGKLRGISLSKLYQIRAEVNDSNARTPAKLFFWKIKELKKKP